MVLIEVQTGLYLGEDDIIFYDDAYARRQCEKTLSSDLWTVNGGVKLS